MNRTKEDLAEEVGQLRNTRSLLGDKLYSVQQAKAQVVSLAEDVIATLRKHDAGAAKAYTAALVALQVH